MKKILSLTLGLTSFVALSATDLEKKLDALNVPTDKVSPMVSQDKLKIINTRYSSLINRHEVTIAGANDFAADSHLETKQAFLTYRYHINPKWSLGLRYSKYDNKLSSAGEVLFKDGNKVPDSDFASSSQELLVSYNTMYGKIRWNSKKVVYFDQYISLGYGKISVSEKVGSSDLIDADLYTLDLGVALWLGNKMSARFGLKNEFYTQERKTDTNTAYNAMGYVEFGYLFGEGNRI